MSDSEARSRSRDRDRKDSHGSRDGRRTSHEHDRDRKDSYGSRDGRRNSHERDRDHKDYYGPGDADRRASRDRSRSREKSNKETRAVWGNVPEEEELERAAKGDNADKVEKVKANFGLSGALAKDEVTGNLLNKVVLKFNEPLDAGAPTRGWRLYIFKGESITESIHINKKSVYVFGRDKRVADVLLLHPACSKQHAVIQFRKTTKEGHGTKVRPFIMDLQSANKTFLNGNAIEDSRYYELKEKDSLRFGLSEREYVLMVAD